MAYAVEVIKKSAILILIAATIFIGITVYFLAKYKTTEKLQTLSPLAKNPIETTDPLSIFKSSLEETLPFGKTINILLIGTDTSELRKAGGQYGLNTDSMILLSVNPEKNIALLTSVPRDLWINGNKINALYTIQGYDSLKNAFEQITGQEIDGYITCDFDGFEWIVDSFGGVPINIERNFTDYNFPNATDTDITTVDFTQGYEKMNGDRALTYARSRKGTNGEGSDLMRTKRQHIILQGMVSAISNPESNFWPMDVVKFYEAVTQHMSTSLTLENVYYLWDFYKDKDLYTVESFVVDDKYLYHPGMYPNSDYHAWVYISRETDFNTLHQDIENKLEGISSVSEQEETNQDMISNF